MAEDKEYSRRLSIPITEEQDDELRRLMPWGQKSSFFRVIIEDVIRLMREHGYVFVGAVCSRQISLEDYMYTRTGEKDETGAPKKELLRDVLHPSSGVDKRNKG